MHPALLALLPVLCAAAPPAFGPGEALRSEWARQPLTWAEGDRARLPAADRARLERAERRIGAPGAPGLLPPELEKPTLEAWLAKAAAARTPRERFDALFFLNRLKSPRALEALSGLTAKDAATWPRHLHLEAQLATARLNGAEVGPELRAFLDARQTLGKVDPVRAQAARLRLVMAGKEKDLLPPVKATPGAVLALMDAWNRAPWEKRQETHIRMLEFLKTDPYFEREHQPETLGFVRDGRFSRECGDLGLAQRLIEGTSGSGNPALLRSLELGLHPSNPMAIRLAALGSLAAWPGSAEQAAPLVGRASLMLLNSEPLFDAGALPAFRKFAPQFADAVRLKYLLGPDPIARAAAIDALAEPPGDLDVLIQRLCKVEEYDGVQVLLNRLEAWKLPVERRKALLERFYEHPCWTARLDAHTHLKKLDPAAPWPTAPEPTAEDRAQLTLAKRLAATGEPVRLRLTFEGKRTVVLRLDPRNAPLNVANLVRLARKGFFDGRRVPRVVPDFVVQMGSPVDTMDGGPGYTVRCENSLDWYGPGSVGMALSGKDTGGSQFFITTNATPHLTGRYTRVGEVENPDRALPMLDALELGARIEHVKVLP